jgi:hypothetical protein
MEPTKLALGINRQLQSLSLEEVNTTQLLYVTQKIIQYLITKIQVLIMDLLKVEFKMCRRHHMSLLFTQNRNPKIFLKCYQVQIG